MYVVTELIEIGTCYVLRSKCEHAHVKRSFLLERGTPF